MKTNHTPGPWGIAPGFESTSQYRNHWRVTAKSPHVNGKMQTVCELNGPWDEENYKANAKLIAAAPELLEAAELAEAAWTGNGDMSTAIDALLLAIAKAKGVQL
jgi:hypothetical protein